MSHDTTPSKVCTKCGEEKPLSEFTQRKSGRRAGKYEARCKDCMRQATAKYIANNPEIAKESQARSYIKRREQILRKIHERTVTDPEYRKTRNDRTRSWRQENRSHIAAYNALRYREEPEILRDAVRASRDRYPEKEKARKAVNRLVASGQFPPATSMICEDCQEALASHWHHHRGYTGAAKTDVIALCTECHGKAHWVD